MRKDLLSLNEEDLISFSNKGTYKRARKEVDLGDINCLIDENDLQVTFIWDDDVECHFPLGKTLEPEDCSCPAGKICRHLLRSILYYQKNNVPDCEIASWTPASFTDEDLAQYFSSAELKRSRRMYEKGLVVEMAQGLKPLALFHDLSLTLRFQVEGQLNYTHCDCDEQAPCSHVPMAVWAFQKLGSKAAGIEFENPPYDDLQAVVNELEKILFHFFREGLNNLDNFTLQQVEYLEKNLRQKDLVFPADIALHLHELLCLYQKQDPRYDGHEILSLLGELLIRLKALRHEQFQIPHTFIKGFKSSKRTGMKNCRFRGLGTLIKEHRKSTEVLVLMQNERTGQIMAAVRNIENKEEHESFAQVANRATFSSVNAHRLGGGRLLISALNCKTDRTLAFTRVKGSCLPQQLIWDDLPGDVLIEDYEQFRQRFTLQPPVSLQPRYIGQNFYVIKVVSHEAPYFDSLTQTFTLKCFDVEKAEIIIELSYSKRGQQGFERMLHLTAESQICYVSGPVSRQNDQLIITPTALVIENDGERQLLQPFIDTYDKMAETSHHGNQTSFSPTYLFISEIKNLLEELLSNGLFSMTSAGENMLAQLQQQAENLGLDIFAEPLRQIGKIIQQKKSGVDDSIDLKPLCQLLIQLRLADDLEAVI